MPTARGVMRQAGTVYQFRHLELQRRLAERRRLGRRAAASQERGGRLLSLDAVPLENTNHSGDLRILGGSGGRAGIR